VTTVVRRARTLFLFGLIVLALSERWVERSFTPWMKTYSGPGEPNYGWSWWTNWFPHDWRARAANGWKGQHIFIFPERDLVVTMTAYLESGESEAFTRLVKDFVIPAVESGEVGQLKPSAEKRARLAAVLAEVQREPLRLPRHPEPRMIPSPRMKDRRRPVWKGLR